MCSSLDTISLGHSELPGIPGSLFPLPDWESSHSLFFQYVFDTFLFLFSFWHPYDLDVGTFGYVPESSDTIIIIFLKLFSSLCSGWMFISSLCSQSLIWIPASFSSLFVPYRLFFISLSVAFISSWVFFILLPYSVSSLSILITSVLNSASDRLVISVSIWFFFWGSVLFFHLGHISLSPQFGSLPVFVSVY